MFTDLPEPIQQLILGAGANLIADVTKALYGRANKLVREALTPDGNPDAYDALTRAVQAAVSTTVMDLDPRLGLVEDEYRDIWERVGEWLVEPEAVYEFRKLLIPAVRGGGRAAKRVELDLDELQDAFERAGLTVQQLYKPDFDALVQEMVGAFYEQAAMEPALQAPLALTMLREVADEMGALAHWQERQAQQGRRMVASLEYISTLGEAAFADQQTQTRLIQAVLGVLEAQHDNQLALYIYSTVVGALNRADLARHLDLGETRGGRSTTVGNLEGAIGTAIGDHNHIEVKPEITPDLHRIEALLADIRNNLSGTETTADAVALEQREAYYRQSLIDLYEKLTFRGISPSARAIALPLADVYVELKAVMDVPEASDSYSAEERRMLLEAEFEVDEGGEHGRTAGRDELVAHLDTLRLERWRREARGELAREMKREAQKQQFERKSIGEIVADSTGRGLVVLGDPGSGKTTLLHYLALMSASQGHMRKL